jgi:hypothetical protein
MLELEHALACRNTLGYHSQDEHLQDEKVGLSANYSVNYSVQLAMGCARTAFF